MRQSWDSYVETLETEWEAKELTEKAPSDIPNFRKSSLATRLSRVAAIAVTISFVGLGGSMLMDGGLGDHGQTITADPVANADQPTRLLAD